MKVNLKNITLTIGVSKKPADIVVSVSIPFKGIKQCCFNRLKNNCIGEPQMMPGSEAAALAYALVEQVRDKLAGSSLELFKNKVSNISTDVIDGHLVITYHTQGTGTALRKTAGVVASCLNPTKLFSKYTENIRFLSGGKPGKKEEFNHLAKILADGIKKEVFITAVGKINTTTDKLKDIIEVIHGKLPDIELPSAKECISPPKYDSNHKDEYPIIKCKGIESAIVADYIRNNSGGMSVGIDEDGITIFNKHWETKHNQLKEARRIKDYIERKYGKLEDRDELSPLFAYFSMANGYCNAHVASQIISSKLTTSKLVELLKKAL